MNLIQALKVVSKFNQVPLLNDGANTWDIDNLLESIGTSETDHNEYVLSDIGIHRLNEYGFFNPIPIYRFE